MNNRIKIVKKVFGKLLVLTLIAMLGILAKFPMDAYASNKAYPFSGTSLGTNFDKATNVAIDNSGNLYVSEGEWFQTNGTIIKIDKSSWGTSTVASGLSYPSNMAFDNSGNIYVVEVNGYKVSKISSSGSVSKVKGDFQLSGLALDSNGYLYTNRNSGLQQGILRFKADGSDDGVILADETAVSGEAVSLATDSSNNLYAAVSAGEMSGTYFTKKLNTSGTTSISDFAKDSANGRYITMGKDGYIYVSDNWDSVIKKFDTSGKLISSFSTGNYLPNALAVDSSGYIYFLGSFNDSTGNHQTLYQIIGNSQTIDATHITLTMLNNTLTGSVTDPNAFILNGVDSDVRVTNAQILGATINLTLSKPIKYGQNVTIDYKKTGTNDLTNSSSKKVDDFKGLKVTNNLPAPASKPTANLAGSAVSSGTKVTLSTTTTDAKIIYTTDGTTPSATEVIMDAFRTNGSNLMTVASTDPNSILGMAGTGDSSLPGFTNINGKIYSEPIEVTTGQTIKAIAVKSGMSNSDVMTETYTIMEQVAKPIANPLGGAVDSGTQVSLSTITAEAKIIYTTDGTTPSAIEMSVAAFRDNSLNLSAVASTDDNLLPRIAVYSDSSLPGFTNINGKVYSAPIAVTTGQTIRAIAVKRGMTNSDVMNETYTIKAGRSQAQDPVISPRGGQVAKGTKVTITSPDGIGILYTTDGSDPYKYGVAYTGSVTIDKPMTINAIATGAAFNCSDVTTESYTVTAGKSQAQDPVISPKGGQVAKGTKVTITSPDGIGILYTTDGSDPYKYGITYTGSITIDKPMTIKAIATGAAFNCSDVTTESYTVTATKSQAQDPVINPKGGAVAKGTAIAITSPDGIGILYTTDGRDPYTYGSVYTQPIMINSAVTIKAVAVGEAYNCSDVSSESYTIIDSNNNGNTSTDSDNDKAGTGTGSTATVETRTVDVVAGTSENSGIAPVKVEIARTVDNGVKIDTVKLDEVKIAETITKAVENKKDMATIIVTDLKGNSADVVEVQVPKTATDKLADKGIGLKIDTPKADIEIPKETLGKVSGDVKFDIKEVTDPSKINDTKALVLSADGDSKILGNPVEIETSFKGSTKITIPLKAENLPKDPAELKKVLDSLAINVHHSDGENVTQKCEIVYDENGNPIAVSTWVDRFSTFTVVGLSQAGMDKLNGNTNNTNNTSNGNNTTTTTTAQVPEIKFVGLGHSPLVEGDKEDFIISSGYNGNVQYRIYLNVDGAWQEVTNGYSASVSGKDTFTITPDYTFAKGQYQGRVYVKKAGAKGSKEENGIDYDNYYTYNINCVDRDDANRVYTTGNLLTDKDTVKVGEKVAITGIDGISGIEGPYYYRLHIYDVANDKWTNNVVPYSEKLEWTPSAAGTYVLDVHVITPNSVLWDNVQNDPEVIYGGYEGWKLKTIKVIN